MDKDQELNEQVAKRLGAYPTLPDMQAEDGTVLRHYKDYVGSIEAAWEITEHIKSNPYNRIRIEWLDNKWYCQLVEDETVGVRAIYCEDTAPLAICKAFLALSETK